MVKLLKSFYYFLARSIDSFRLSELIEGNSVPFSYRHHVATSYRYPDYRRPDRILLAIHPPSKKGTVLGRGVTRLDLIVRQNTSLVITNYTQHAGSS